MCITFERELQRILPRLPNTSQRRYKDVLRTGLHPCNETLSDLIKYGGQVKDSLVSIIRVHDGIAKKSSAHRH